MRGYVVVDLEATCWQQDAPHPNEIIEIGAVVLRAGAAAPDSGGFQQLVRPRLAPVLSAFCTELTTIVQADVDAAPTFADALPPFVSWIEETTGDPAASAVLASWGSYDWRQLQQDCERGAVPFPFTRHLNVRRAYAALARRRGRPESLTDALARLDLPPDGTPHRALDDARNAARVLAKLLATAPVEIVEAAGNLV